MMKEKNLVKPLNITILNTILTMVIIMITTMVTHMITTLTNITIMIPTVKKLLTEVTDTSEEVVVAEESHGSNSPMLPLT